MGVDQTHDELIVVKFSLPREKSRQPRFGVLAQCSRDRSRCLIHVIQCAPASVTRAVHCATAKT
jgi:hypothetical protein